MRIKKIAAVCGRTKTLEIDRTPGVLWLGNGQVVMPLFGFEGLLTEQIEALVGITDANRDKWLTYENKPDETDTAVYDDYNDDDELLERSRIKIWYRERLAEPFITKSGLIFVDDAAIEVFDKEYKNICLYLRTLAPGRHIVIVKEGMFTKGLIEIDHGLLTGELACLLYDAAQGVEQQIKPNTDDTDDKGGENRG